MKKRILFFSRSFAFNRLVRMRYYEKIFPKDVEMFLATTDKYGGDAENQIKQWNLKRTKVVVMSPNRINLSLDIRKFCRENDIDVVSNLGHPFGAIPLIIGKIFTKTKLNLYFLGDTLETPKTDMFTKIGIRLLLTLLPYQVIVRFADKIAFIGKMSYNKAPAFFILPKKKFYCLHAPVNTEIFYPVDKKKARKELKFGEKDKIIIYVGRVSERKSGKMLTNLIKNNPEVKFVVVGRWLENEIPRLKVSNLISIEKIQNTELFKYYSAADLSFACHLQGYPMGIVGEESLACGTPILHIKGLESEDSQAIVRIDDSDANEKVRNFFELPEKKRKSLGKTARKYAVEHLSDDVWKEKYLDFYLG